MMPLNKLCDAVDWLDPEFDRIVRTELIEEPRLHRKQWEFAHIFRALQALGRLNGLSRGLSMGAGQERLLYSVARHAGHLTVTDLYESESAWNGARTDDPDRSIKAAAPFPVDCSNISAKRMDMRALEFGDALFDFCYSSCAIEHIGDHDDFLAHLREVRRVLKSDGVYVLTTEFHYGDDVIPVRDNYYFSIGYLRELIDAAGLAVAGVADGRVRPHPLNRPLPSNLSDLYADTSKGAAGLLRQSMPHVQLLTGGEAFTSLCLVLRKAPAGHRRDTLFMDGLDDTRRFIEAGVRSWKAFVESTQLDLDPFGLNPEDRLKNGTSRRAGDDRSDTLFHTGYVWLGGVSRTAAVDLDVCPSDGSEVTIDLRVHKRPTKQPDLVTPVSHVTMRLGRRDRVHVLLPVSVEDGASYAVLGKVAAGSCCASNARVRIESGSRAV
jgi:SAM-dependent methyltransferase